MQAMILAAGFGTRLLPYTKLRPKPLFPLLNEPLLLLTIRRLQAAGFDHIIVNCHYLKEQIVAALAGMPGVIIQEEETVLGTGGGLRMALSHLRNEPLLISNGDIYHTVDYRGLYRTHKSNHAVVTMAMHDYDRFNSVDVHGDRVHGFSTTTRGEEEDLLAFTGIHVLDKSVIEQIPGGCFFHIIDLYAQLAEADRVGSVRVDDCFWRDIGTPADYLDLHRELLCGCKNRQSVSHDDARFWCIGEQVAVADDVVFREWGVVGRGAKIGRGSRLTRCVVWENVNITSGQELTDTIICQDMPGASDA